MYKMTQTQTNNYSSKLLQSNTTSLFITIPQTTIDYEILHNKLAEFKHTKYLITKLEQHEDGGLHIHILIMLKATIRISAIHSIIIQQEGTIKGLIDYDKIKHLAKTINYIKKTDTSIEDKPYLEFGQLSDRIQQQVGSLNLALLDAIQKATEGNIDDAMQDIKNIDPLKYLIHKQVIKENLKTENATRKKYTPPDMSKHNITLTAQQQKVWELLQTTPKQRRIIWVTGQYGSGKSFLMNYISKNHEYLMYNAGQSIQFDNVAYGYDEEGVIAWDLPRTFDFQNYGDALANVIEKFSDFGQTITSKKYNGKTQQVLGHAIVFSNHNPIHQLLHRDIIHIDLSNEQDQNDNNIINQTQPIVTPEIKPYDNKVINTDSSSDEEETVKSFIDSPLIKTDTQYIDIKQLQKGSIIKYIKQYKTNTGRIMSQTLPTLEQAINFMPKDCNPIF